MAFTRFSIRAADGTELSVGAHPAAGEGPVLLILHGLFSHMGWYQALGESMFQQGAAVYLVDRRGAGRSEGTRGHMLDWRILVDDVLQVVHQIRTLHPGRPIHVLGISLGGTVSLATSILHPDAFASQILLSPGLAALVRLPLQRKLGLLQRSVLQPTRMYDLPFSEEALTDHPEWRKALREDPFKTQRVSARFLVEMFRMQSFVRSRMAQVRLPALVLLAENDQLVNNEVTLEAFRRSRSPRVRIEIFEGAAHILPASVPDSELLDRFWTWFRHAHASIDDRMSVVKVPRFNIEGLDCSRPPLLALTEQESA